jgi:hypothetical protein
MRFADQTSSLPRSHGHVGLWRRCGGRPTWLGRRRRWLTRQAERARDHQQAPDDAYERSGETVLAFLVSGGSPTRVAEKLFVHKNTVAERIKKAEELLGREISESPIELGAALTLAFAMGRVVHGDGEGHR